jgi:cytochrome c-type biogenesis protein CcmF
MLAHFGLGIALLGIIGETQWGFEALRELKPGQSVSVPQYDITLEGTTTQPGPNYREIAAHFAVHRNGSLIGVMEPAKRTFPSRGAVTTETALLRRGLSQIYVSIGEFKPDGALGVRIYYKPLVLLIWLGPVAMAIGGALSLCDRRLRFGVPKSARGKTGLASARW